MRSCRRSLVLLKSSRKCAHHIDTTQLIKCVSDLSAPLSLNATDSGVKSLAFCDAKL
jgi:hypothetical protein